MPLGPLIAPLPLIELGPSYSIVLEAIDPTTGATVAGVAVTDITIYARGGGGDDLPLSNPSYILEAAPA